MTAILAIVDGLSGYTPSEESLASFACECVVVVSTEDYGLVVQSYTPFTDFLLLHFAQL